MHFRNSQATWQTGPNTLSISMTESLPNLLITLKVIGLEKVSLSDMQNLKNVC